MEMYELSFDRFGSDRYDIREVRVTDINKKCITVTDGCCTRYSGEPKTFLGDGLKNVTAYAADPQYCESTCDAYLLPEYWMAEVLRTQLAVAWQARNCVNRVGLGNLPLNILRQIVAFGKGGEA